MRHTILLAALAIIFLAALEQGDVDVGYMNFRCLKPLDDNCLGNWPDMECEL